MVNLPTDAENMVKAQRSQSVKCQKPGKGRGVKGRQGGERKGKEAKIELRAKKKKDKKESLQHRNKTLGLDGESLDCCVLLTRLEEKKLVVKDKDVLKTGKQKSAEVKKKLESGSVQRHTKSGLKKASTVNQRALKPKTNQSDALLMMAAPVFEPRRRRMASLNAEAVNSLLLYKDDPLLNLTKKHQPSDEVLTKTEPKSHKSKQASIGGKTGPKERTKKLRRSAVEAQNIDWLALFAPTPRRQAGLTAATLLKLTSTAYGSKRQKKTESKPESGTEAATKSQDEISSKPSGGETTLTKRTTHPKQEDQVKHKHQGKEDPIHSQLEATMQGCCSLCKGDTLDPDWTGTAGGEECLKNPLHCSSSLGFPLKTIKEEQVEAEVSSCYCCSQERCVKYCHRMALFLKDKTFKEPDDSSLSEVFHHYHHHHHHHHHHLQSAHSVGHPAAITISPHTYTCFPGYYVHFSRQDNAPSPISPLTLCPRGGKRPKLLPSTGPQPSGISHPMYCCTSVEACYGEPCRINGYSSYTSVIPTIARGGCFSPAECGQCNHGIKRGKQTLQCYLCEIVQMS